MKNILFFLALLLVVTSNVFAETGNVASKDTINGWHFLKVEGVNQDSTWTSLFVVPTELQRIFQKSTQLFGLRSKGPTTYYWIKKLDKKYSMPRYIDGLFFLRAYTGTSSTNAVIVEFFLGNQEKNAFYRFAGGAFFKSDVGTIGNPMPMVDSSVYTLDSIDYVVLGVSFVTQEPNYSEILMDNISLVYRAKNGADSLVLIDDGGEPKFAKFKIAKPKVSFGAVAQGIKRVDSVLVTNIGDAPLVISKIWTDNAHFSAKCSITTIAPQASTNVVVEFTQDSVSGVKKGKLLVEHNGLSKLDSIELVADFMTSVGDEDHLPKEFSLSQNYPNPFNPNTTIKYSVENKQHVKLTVYDLLGKEVAVLVDGEVGVGEHSAVFNAKNLSSGVYLYRIQSDNFVATKRMTLLK